MGKLLSPMEKMSWRRPQEQESSLCPQDSRGRPGLRTSIRILSVWAQDVARWPRIHGPLG